MAFMRVVELDPALVDDDDPLADLLDLGQDVRREQDGVLAAESRMVLSVSLICTGSRPRGRLVEDEDGRVGEHGVGQADALAVALRERAEQAVLHFLDAALLQAVVDAGGAAVRARRP